MDSLHDPLDFHLSPPNRVYHFAEQDLTTRMRVEAWESHQGKYSQTVEAFEAFLAELERRKAREAAKAARLARWGVTK